MGRENHYRDVFGGLIPANAIQHFPPVHAGESNIEDNEVWRLRTDRRKTALTVVPGDDLEVGSAETDFDQPSDDG
jgi:hypothetical protein